MVTYAAMVTVTDREFQNVQELASIWGEVRSDLEEHDVGLRETYAVLGAVDFLVTFDVPDRDAAFQVALAIERHGLDTHTMEIAPTEDFAELVDDT